MIRSLRRPLILTALPFYLTAQGKRKTQFQSSQTKPLLNYLAETKPDTKLKLRFNLVEPKILIHNRLLSFLTGLIAQIRPKTISRFTALCYFDVDKSWSCNISLSIVRICDKQNKSVL